MQQVRARQYRILGVLGMGGFGKVYRARLEDDAGFSKDVAIKLLSAEDVPDTVLERFRDEARILGLLRHRAVVGVEPPTRLGSRWAVVMEYVDGVSADHLVKEFGKLPVRVVVEIISEVARALDAVYRQPGPDGEPLMLLHRDIKPANIQVTPSGEVKILDFGIAKAEFSNREAKTTQHIGGTPGFIAPERLEGIEEASGDIFSLGVTLELLLTGKRPRFSRLMSGRDSGSDDVTDMRPKDQDVALIKALALAYEMRDQDHEARPNARAVERACDELLRESGGMSLRDWAEENVRPAPADVEVDEVVGRTLSETLSAVPVAPSSPDSAELRIDPPSGSTMPTRTGVVAVAGGASLLAVAVVFLAFGLAAVAGVLLYNGTNTNDISDAMVGEVAVAAEPEAQARPDIGLRATQDVDAEPGAEEAPADTEDGPAEAAETEAGEAEIEAGEAETEAAEEATEAATVRTAPDPSDRPVVPTSAPAKTAATPEPQPVAKTYPVTFTSVPLGATVYIDGKKAGAAPLPGFGLTSGSHEVRMELNGVSSSTTIRVGRRSPTRHVWRAVDASWEANL